MKVSYGQRLFICFLAIFALFTLGVAWFERAGEREYKTRALEERLDAYIGTARAISKRPGVNLPRALDSLLFLFPPELRLTLVDSAGVVIYDNTIRETASLENHATRPEIVAARTRGVGSDTRVSTSNDREYLYRARLADGQFIRVALPNDIRVRDFLQPGNLFLYYIALLFIVVMTLANYISRRFGRSIRQLRDFTNAVDREGEIPFVAPVSRDELGEIVTKIAENYHRLKESKRAIALEREKLLQHVHGLEEGVCFFSADGSVEFYNSLFIQYLNTITDEANGDPALLFSDKAFEPISSFLASSVDSANRDAYFETRVNKHGKNFALRVNLFDDKSFEIIINDVTNQEKTRLLKQEMTGNITHELRTPVTAIRGCLETVLSRALEPDKERHFIRSAYNQVLALSELIQDMSLITKIEDAPQSFQLEPVNIPDLLADLRSDLEISLREKNIRVTWEMPGDTRVKGNRNLIYSIFRNLTDNAIRYAGNDAVVRVNLYREDKRFYYFSYSDTGVGIPDERHLNRLFERFYRINEGRTRDTGGSGLGLSIVKNAVAFHKGTIVVKNRAGGGLEFLFGLPRES
ncbi:MAG: HAMP domain-containing histidine kinase [Odoribacteraceae bacterium]|jgi:signal transduction histidine kinase|nr:HAMP domain-containing histidine kinase [Odoribacteraceae bacterium]